MQDVLCATQCLIEEVPRLRNQLLDLRKNPNDSAG